MILSIPLLYTFFGYVHTGHIVYMPDFLRPRLVLVLFH